jgi:hypothetical protein
MFVYVPSLAMVAGTRGLEVQVITGMTRPSVNSLWRVNASMMAAAGATVNTSTNLAEWETPYLTFEHCT